LFSAISTHATVPFDTAGPSSFPFHFLLLQWLNYSARGGGSLQARLEGPKLEPKGLREQVVLLTADQGFLSIQGIPLGFYSIQIVFDAWILPSRVVDPRRKVTNLNCEVQDLLLEVVDLK